MKRCSKAIRSTQIEAIGAKGDRIAGDQQGRRIVLAGRGQQAARAPERVGEHAPALARQQIGPEQIDQLIARLRDIVMRDQVAQQREHALGRRAERRGRIVGDLQRAKQRNARYRLAHSTACKSKADRW